ncbi:hypothetical protein WMY93_011419 [Mugilogobius chulae]|uniref:Cytohesin Ubiquitin Protein Inducing domain-containing protein n=1 Tax=Mugilogobius chulae TaxID=88201 RepID=A0AAW0P2F7_9GOBI
MEGTAEMSDSDSGIILHSGSDSPTSHSKDVTTHTRAMKLKHQALQESLELCLLELRKLCIREAELTGKLSEDYPLKAGEKPPQIRRRVGAAFKLDELSLPQKNGSSELISVDAELALQMKIYEAARRLCDEQGLKKNVRKSRLQQCKREELKLKQLQETAFKLRLERGRTSPLPALNITQPDPGTSDDSSLSDSVVQDEDASSQSSHLLPSEPDALTPMPQSTPSTPCSSLNSAPTLNSTLSLSSSLALDDPPPIEHSPWSESNLDQPLDPKKKSRSSSKKSTPVKTELLPPLEECLAQCALNSQLSHLKLSRSQSSSTPSTPEMRVHRQLSLRLSGPDSPYNHEKERGRTRSARRRLTEYNITYTEPSPSPSPSALKTSLNYNNHAGSEDSNSEHSYSSYNSSPCHESPCDLPKHYHSNVFSNGSYQAQIFPHSSYFHKAQSSSPELITRRWFTRRKWTWGEVTTPSRRFLTDTNTVTERLPFSSIREFRGLRKSDWSLLRRSRSGISRSRVRTTEPRGRFGEAGSNEQLKSWHRRSSQLKTPRSRSLDRQGAVRFKSTPSPMATHVYQPPAYQEQVIQRRPQRPLDDSSGHWILDDGTHYISQVNNDKPLKKLTVTHSQPDETTAEVYQRFTRP